MKNKKMQSFACIKSHAPALSYLLQNQDKYYVNGKLRLTFPLKISKLALVKLGILAYHITPACNENVCPGVSVQNMSTWQYPYNNSYQYTTGVLLPSLFK